MTSSFDIRAGPTRRRLLDALRSGECSVAAPVKLLKMNQPAVSTQLQLLRESGLASLRVDGQRRMYRLNPVGLRQADAWLAPFRVYWEGRLDEMERILESMED